MKRTIIFIISQWIFSLVLTYPVFAQYAKSTDKVLTGAIRWDAWHTPAMNKENNEQGGAVKAVERSLSPKRYHFRVPFFGKIISDSVIKIDGYNQTILDQEIEFAKQGGLDYWAFLLYDPQSSMSQGLSLYLSSKKRDDINFCAIASPDNFCDDIGSGNGNSRLLKLIKEQGYQKVMNNRPIIYIFRPEDEWIEKVGGTQKARQLIDSFRMKSIRTNCGDPYLVVMHFNIEHAKKMADILGAEAISDYAIWGNGGLNGSPYSELTASTRNAWIKSEATGAQVVPLVMTGWDRRPRIERPVPWETGWQKPYDGMEKYFALPTPEELAEHLKEAIMWTKERKQVCPAKAVIIYAWNEHDEGGWLCPTISENNDVDDSRLKALKKVLESIK
jgi:hypothetical protein